MKAGCGESFRGGGIAGMRWEPGRSERGGEDDAELGVPGSETRKQVGMHLAIGIVT